MKDDDEAGVCVDIDDILIFDAFLCAKCLKKI